MIGATASSPLFPVVGIPKYGIRVETEIEHDAANDDPGADGYYGYTFVAGEAAVPAPSGSIGDPFYVEYYTAESETNPLTIHSGTEQRWERDDRNQVHVDQKYIEGNTERIEKGKLPADTVYDEDLPTVAILKVWSGTSAAFSGLSSGDEDYPTAGNKTLYIVTT